jgi:hypothetical protein
MAVPDEVRFLGAVELPIVDAPLVRAIGCEVRWRGSYCLRIGARMPVGQSAGLAGGIGVHFGRYRIDYAVRSVVEGGLQHSAAFNLIAAKLTQRPSSV